jgi:hypothetical protein
MLHETREELPMPTKVRVDRRVRLSLPELIRQGRVVTPGGRLDFVIETDIQGAVKLAATPELKKRFARKDEARRGLGARILKQRGPRWAR